MRTLSATLESAQKDISAPPIWKVVLSRTGQTTLGYDQNRLWKISHLESPSDYNAELVLNNSDTTLTSLDLEHYQAVISYGYNTGVSRTTFVAGSTYTLDTIVVPANTNGYQYRCSIAGVAGSAEPTWPTDLGVTVASSAATFEMDGNTGEEYSRTSPLRVRSQNLLSGRGILRCILQPAGIPNQLAEDKAEDKYDLTSGDTQTVKTLITAVAGTSLAAYPNYTAYTVTYDSEDTLIDTFQPKDYFSIRLNENRLDKIQELLDFTGCKMRPENDGNIHIQDPTISGTAYNYEYKFNVAGDHNFWSKSVRLRFVNPNREIVESHPDHDPQYAGTATSTASYALAPKTHTTHARLASIAQASSIASAKIERYELDAERGFAVVPMNVGQELWDYVKVTDSRQNDTRIGNIQYLKRDVEVYQNGRALNWIMSISLGKVTQQSLLANMLVSGTEGGLTDTDIYNMINRLGFELDDLADIVDGIIDYLNDTAIPAIATIAETDTGTDEAKAVSPDGLAGSDFGEKVVYIQVITDDTALTTGDGKAYFTVPPTLNGMDLVDADAAVATSSSSGLPTIQINNQTQAADMLSTRITIDVSEFNSYTAATAPVIDTANDDIASADILRIDVDVAGTGTKGLQVALTFRKP